MGELDTAQQALDVQVMDNEVVLLGPRVAIALSAAAAAETAKRLAEAAVIAGRNRSPLQHHASHTLSADE